MPCLPAGPRTGTGAAFFYNGSMVTTGSHFWPPSSDPVSLVAGKQCLTENFIMHEQSGAILALISPTSLKEARRELFRPKLEPRLSGPTRSSRVVPPLVHLSPLL